MFYSLRAFLKGNFVPYADPIRRHWTRNWSTWGLDPLAHEVISLELILLGVVGLWSLPLSSELPPYRFAPWIMPLVVGCISSLTSTKNKGQPEFTEDLQCCAQFFHQSVAELALLATADRYRLATASLVDQARRVLLQEQEEQAQGTYWQDGGSERERGVFCYRYDTFFRLGLVAEGGYGPFFQKAKAQPGN